MLVITRRPGESVRIGDNIELLIVDVDRLDLEARCAISVSDHAGNELRLQAARIQQDVTLVRTLGWIEP